MLDLDDLQVETLRLFNEHSDIRRKYALQFPHIFVDEYQDTNPVQVELLKESFTPEQVNLKIPKGSRKALAPIFAPSVIRIRPFTVFVGRIFPIFMVLQMTFPKARPLP
jgi:hypothetical protein